MPITQAEASRPKHPGRTVAERRALDAIGCGDFLPRMHPRVRDRLLQAGLIVEAGSLTRRDALGSYSLPQYEMPPPVHMAWCAAVAAEGSGAAGPTDPLADDA